MKTMWPVKREYSPHSRRNHEQILVISEYQEDWGLVPLANYMGRAAVRGEPPILPFFPHVWLLILDERWYRNYFLRISTCALPHQPFMYFSVFSVLPDMKNNGVELRGLGILGWENFSVHNLTAAVQLQQVSSRIKCIFVYCGKV
jgi:hypothetical protein